MRDFKIEDKDFDAIQKRGYLNSRIFDLDKGKQVLGIESLESIDGESFSTLLRYIVDLLDIYLNYYDEKKPYCPQCSGNGRRSMIPEDISKEQAEGLFRNLNKIESPYIKSRIADILWYIKKLGKNNNVDIAKIVIESYYKSAEYFINNCKLSKFFLKFAIGQLERLSIIILSLKNIPEKEHIYNKLLEYLDNITDIEFISGVFRIFSLRLKLNKGEAKVVIEKLEKLIKLLGDEINGFSLRELYSMGAKIAEKSGELNKRRNFKILKAENFVEEADKIEGWTIKSDFLKEAILLYQNDIPNKKNRVEELKKKLAEAQINIKDEMRTFIFDVDDLLEPCIKMIKQLVSGVEFEEAIIRFINYFPKSETLVAQAENYTNPSFIDSISNDVCDSEGKTVYISRDPVNNKMIRDVNWFCYTLTNAIIIPAIKTIQNEHVFSYETIHRIVKDSSFIPKRHEFIFAKGLYHFLKFEIIEAVSLLVPQIENSLRYILKNADVNTDVIKSNKIEQSKTNIEYIINLCSSNNLISKTYSFYLEKILIHPPFSLRHNIAHGKAEDFIEQCPYSFVLCFLVFHLVMVHKIEHYNKINPKIKKLKSIMTNLNKYKEIIDIFMKENKFLFKENVCEISFMSRLGNILSKEFSYFDVDIIEYNQNIMEVKKLDIRYNLIIHKRIDQDNNMFVCEVRKSNNNENYINIGKNRIKQMTLKESKCHYKIGCFIFINNENKTLRSFWYENGKEISILEHKNI